MTTWLELAGEIEAAAEMTRDDPDTARRLRVLATTIRNLSRPIQEGDNK